MTDSTVRFGNRVEDYERYRPRYPEALAEWLRSLGLGPGSVLADVGAGTAILGELLLPLGCEMWFIEPNAAMMAVARHKFADHPRATFLDAPAEHTGLEDGSIDLVVAGQAFHWFDPQAAQTEFRRILRPGGRVLLVWNDRKAPGDPFMEDYERLLETWGEDYRKTTWRSRITGEVLGGFFNGPYQERVFENRQVVDEAGLLGRFVSSSYSPARGTPGFSRIETAAKELFARWEEHGHVTLRYDTLAFLGSV